MPGMTPALDRHILGMVPATDRHLACEIRGTAIDPGCGSISGASTELLGDLGLALQPRNPSGPYIGTTGFPRSSRPGISAITRRLATAFCSSAQVGSRSKPARTLSSARSGYGPRQQARAARQARHSTAPLETDPR
jgi:hypothetical protein